MKSFYRSVSFIIAAVLSLQFASAQLKLEVKQIDATSLPQIRLKVALTKNSQVVRQPGHATYGLTENGKPVTIDVLCPDSADHNSIALVLDNSGSMAGPAITALGIAASALVDSLRPVDAAALYTFGTTVTLAQDYTTDKAALRGVLSSMSVGGGTPLFDASYLAVQSLATRSGKKVCVVFTDGVDNASTKMYRDVVALALTTGTTIFTIGFGNGLFDDLFISEMSRLTNGRHFRIFGPEEMAAVFNAIASDILSPDCMITYTMEGCTDSIRALHLEATLDGQSTSADTVFVSPSRPDTLRLRVIAPPEVGPGGSALVYIALEPGMHTGLEMTYSFLLRYDPNLLTVNPVAPITVGTMTQNTAASVWILRDGVLQFKANRVHPSIAAGNLIGVRMKGLPSDSSRPVILSIDSVSFEAGCPNVVFVYPDTIDVCQCTQQISAWLDKSRISVSGSELRVPVYVSDTSLAQSFEFTAWMQYDVDRLTPLSVEPIKPAGTHIRLQMDIITPGIIRITGRSDTPMKDSILLNVSFRTAKVKQVDETVLLLPTFKAYAHCCLSLEKDASQSIMIDGVCEQIVVRKSRATLRQNFPNPANGATLVPFQIFPVDKTTEENVRLVIFNEQGKQVALLHEGSLGAGEYRISFNASTISSGKYTIVLYIDNEVHIRNMEVVQ